MNIHSLIEESISEENLDPCNDPSSYLEWGRFGFFLCHRLIRKIRKISLRISSIKSFTKADLSPSTSFEEDIEKEVKSTANAFYPDVGFYGEESGPDGANKEIQIILDPIDGTYSFLSCSHSYSLTLAITSKQSVLVAMIAIPSTGEVFFRLGKEPTQLMQYAIFHDSYEILDLPLTSMPEVLINFHSFKTSAQYLNKLYNLWNKNKVSLVRSISGSPAYFIAEASKGNSVYINAWNKGNTKPYDLLSSCHIIQGCSGHVIDIHGANVDPLNHEGVLLAGLDLEVLDFIRGQLTRLDGESII